MSADRLLSTLLRVLREPPGRQDTPRILGTIASLLAGLNNPLNVTLLVSHVLAAPALWATPQSLRFCLDLMGVFHAAVKSVLQRELNDKQSKPSSLESWRLASTEPHIPLSKWIRAVLEGADSRSPPHRHVLVLVGVLVGLEAERDPSDHGSSAIILQEAVVRSANAALLEHDKSSPAGLCIVLALTHALPALPDFERSQISHDLLLPLILQALLYSDGGLASACFLRAIDHDTRQSSATQFIWSAESPSFLQLQDKMRSPIIHSMSALSRLAAYTIRHVRDSRLVSTAIDDVATFSTAMFTHWRSNKLSEVHVTEESIYLHPESIKITLPILWQLLRSTLFATVIILQSAIGRLLADGALARDIEAPRLAAQCLLSLHNLNFVFARLSSAAFSQYTFVHLTCIDILNSYPSTVATFLRGIASAHVGTIPSNPLDRVSDLFFLNTAEHFTLALPPADTDALLIAAATPYLTAVPTPALRPIFEAAHSVMLAIFAAPRNAALTAAHLPLYVGALLESFPQNLSPRQFRLAFRSLVQLASPPSDLSHRQPLLPAILLDLVLERAKRGGTHPLPDPSAQLDLQKPAPPLSEQATMVLALIDALPSVEPALLGEWLPLLPGTIDVVEDAALGEHCVRHLWETFVGGAMDPERAQVCVRWWTTAGGREAVLRRGGGERYVMSGALPVENLAKM